MATFRLSCEFAYVRAIVFGEKKKLGAAFIFCLVGTTLVTSCLICDAREMKILLWIIKIIVGIPIIYYSSALYMHYRWHDSWETSYQMAPLCTVGMLFVLAIYYAIKQRG